MKDHKEELIEAIDTIAIELTPVKDSLSIPRKEDYENFKGTLNISVATLFADFAGFTEFVDSYDLPFVSWTLMAYLKCVSSIIHRHGGVVSAFEGDGLMGLFAGEDKESTAVKCAFQIQWAVTNIIQPKLDALFPDKEYKIAQVIGIDASELAAVKTDIWDHYDLLWVGRSANYSANLTRINDPNYSTYITSHVYEKLVGPLNNSSRRTVWELMEEKVGDISIYRSNTVIPL